MNSPTLLSAQPLDISFNEINLENCIKDSPFYKAALNSFEDNCDDLQKWLDSICKLIKAYSDEFNSNYFSYF